MFACFARACVRACACVRALVPDARCKWSPDHEAAAAPLHVVLALFSTGPVGVSDAINGTDAALLNRTIAQNGVLLQPSKAISAVDSAMAGPASG